MEDENFNPVAQSRANYYTPGSPVQFVRVELLRGEESGSNAVCLTFKNIGQEELRSLSIRFKCKNAQGEVLCEDSYNYEDIEAATGDLFGMDDAVFVTDQAIGSVDVTLNRAAFAHHSEQLGQYQRVRLPAPKRLTKLTAEKLQQTIGRKGLKYAPQVLENGWYCACGAFHPNEEDTVYCSECGSDRILLQNALSSIETENEPTRVVSSAPGEEPTRVVSDYARATGANGEGSPTREVKTAGYRGESAGHFAENYHSEAPAEKPKKADPRDAVAENIIRWVPAITALICAAIAFGGFVYCQFFLK